MQQNIVYITIPKGIDLGIMRKYWTEAKLVSQILLLSSKGLDASAPPALLSAPHLFFTLSSASWINRCPHSSSIFNILGCLMPSRSSFRAPYNGLLGPHERPGLSLRNYSAHTEDYAGKFLPPLFPSVLHDSKANNTILGFNHSFLVPFLSSIYIVCISFCSICSFLL